MLKLNLGCGRNPLAGYVNADKEGDPEVKVDLEREGWPWPDSSAEEVVLNHVLEHIGALPEDFLYFMKELYRVCAHGALVKIAVPHPRHDHFLGDPTHVRAITPEVLSLFSKTNCQHWAKQRAANTPLALYLGVDFEIVRKSITLEPRYHEALESGALSALQIDEALRERNNVASEIRVTLRVVKQYVDVTTLGDPEPVEVAA